MAEIPGSPTPIEKKSWFRVHLGPESAAWALLLGSAVSLGILASGRPTLLELRADESTYVAMAQSLLRDGDLLFTWADRTRVESLGPEATVILQRSRDSALAYSKPILFPLLVAPWDPLLGVWAPLLVNLLAVLGGAWVLYRSLRERLGAAGAARAIATLLGAGSALAWLGWRMSEAVQLGLALVFAGGILRLPEPNAPGAPGRRRAFLSPVVLAGLAGGLLASLREPNALLLLGSAVACWSLAGRREALQMLAGGALSYGFVLLLTWQLIGSAWPYKAERTTFSQETGWPVGPGSEEAMARFGRDDAWATSSLGLLPSSGWDRSAYGLLYSLVGRHSGALPYFAGGLTLFLLGVWTPRRRRWLLGPVALGAFYLVWMPGNYFGGETFVGNRYFLPALALLPLALERAPSWKQLAPAWIVALVAAGSAGVSQTHAQEDPPTSQLHAYAGLFRMLPYESTAAEIDGRRDRYWSGEFVRFVDPFARVGPWSFELRQGNPPAELLLARPIPHRPLFLLISTDGPASLRWSDWAGRGRSSRIGGEGGGSTAVYPIELSPAWRVHRFWWDPRTFYRAHTLRLSIDSPRRGTLATIRYLGSSGPPEEGYGWVLEGFSAPRESRAGRVVWIPLRLRNSSSFAWSTEAVLPVQVGYRLSRLDGPTTPREGRTPLPRPAAPGEILEATVRLEVPLEPGRYRVEVDLVLEEVAWFSTKVGRPIADFTMEVAAEDATVPAIANAR